MSDNRTKVEQLLKSDTPEDGIELLKSLNEPELNQAVSDLIKNAVNNKYFEGKSEQEIVNQGLAILNQLLPKVRSLSIVGCYTESLDFSNFLELESLDLSGCDCLKEIKGLSLLSKLNKLDLSYTSTLNLDANDYSHIKDVIGLRNKYGMFISSELEQYYWDCLSEYIDELVQDLVDDNYGDFDRYTTELDNCLGTPFIILIEESDLYEKSFQSNREYFKPLKDVLNDEQIEHLPKLGKDYQKDDIAVFLFTNGWDFVTSFYKNKDETPDEDEFDMM